MNLKSCAFVLTEASDAKIIENVARIMEFHVSKIKEKALYIRNNVHQEKKKATFTDSITNSRTK